MAERAREKNWSESRGAEPNDRRSVSVVVVEGNVVYTPKHFRNEEKMSVNSFVH